MLIRRSTLSVPGTYAYGCARADAVHVSTIASRPSPFIVNLPPGLGRLAVARNLIYWPQAASAYREVVATVNDYAASTRRPEGRHRGCDSLRALYARPPYAPWMLRKYASTALTR